MWDWRRSFGRVGDYSNRFVCSALRVTPGCGGVRVTHDMCRRDALVLALSSWWVAWSLPRSVVVTAASSSYNGHRYPPEIIARCVWLYHRFPLSFREVEELMLQRGVVVSYETIRQWCAKFGQVYANRLRRRRAWPGDKWHLDEVFIGSTARSTTCGARSASTAMSSTSWCSHAEMRWPPRSSSADRARDCGTCRGCSSPKSSPATGPPTAW